MFSYLTYLTLKLRVFTVEILISKGLLCEQIIKVMSVNLFVYDIMRFQNTSGQRDIRMGREDGEREERDEGGERRREMMGGRDTDGRAGERQREGEGERQREGEGWEGGWG